jgi:alkanesulfonate monooxygenase SsuD/methylene tetrahydromethanopterin reductase-like flavin-dependent oxidoreductase (luciferase family)
LRSLLQEGCPSFAGRFYSTAGLTLEPRPARPEGPPIWVGSWGSPPGLRRVARLADGWLASAYNTTPATFADAWHRLRELLPAHGKDATTFPNALGTMWCYVTEDRSEAERILRERVAPTIHRPEEVLRERLPIGPAEAFAEKLSAFARAGVQRVFIWPVADEVRQLELFWEQVRPAVVA